MLDSHWLYHWYRILVYYILRDTYNDTLYFQKLILSEVQFLFLKYSPIVSEIILLAIVYDIPKYNFHEFST